jgi:hypothetical protein
MEVYVLTLEINFLRAKAAPNAPSPIAGENTNGIGTTSKSAPIKLPGLPTSRSAMVSV